MLRLKGDGIQHGRVGVANSSDKNDVMYSTLFSLHLFLRQQYVDQQIRYGLFATCFWSMGSISDNLPLFDDSCAF